MNATRAASIRLRAAFDGAVSLGRVQTPTLALVARREEEIRAFKPEPYWLVEARFEPLQDDRAQLRRPLPRRQAAPRGGGGGHRRGVRGTATAAITKLEKKEERELPDFLYDLTSLQRHANTLFGFSARRTLSAAQRLYEEHTAITYPRTSSRYLSGDLVEEIRPTAELVGRNAEYARGAAYVTGLTELPLGRVVNDAKVTDHHAIIPTRAEHDLGPDGRGRAQDLRPHREAFPRRLPPRGASGSARGSRRRSRSNVFRTSGRVLDRGRLARGLRRGCQAASATATRTTPAATSSCRGSSRTRRPHGRESSRCARRPSRRGATRRPRCSARWRPPARTSRRPSCARR